VTASARSAPLDLGRELNPEQVEAATHGTGPQLVLAGAGTGKTRVITYRMAWLIEQGVEPWQIAAVTFTNKAANEMRERVLGLVGSGAEEVFVGTFHRFALRLLRRYGERVGLPSGFTVLDVDDQLAIMKRALEAERLDLGVFAPRAVLSRVSAAKNRLLSPAELEREATGFWEQQIANAYRAYQDLLRQSAAADFDDLIALAVRLLQREHELKERMRQRLRHLLVDEFQDTNDAQLALVLCLAGSAGNLTAVGDEDQGIYRWRGAKLGNILEFEASFPTATIRKLERNYRSTQTILDASGHLVAHNQQRRGKELWTDAGVGEPLRLFYARDEADEARFIATSIERSANTQPYHEVAILVRTNAQTRALEDELLRRRLPYQLIAGTRFYERAEIKDVIAYLRVLRNPRDNLSLRRILNVPTRGIGKATQELLFSEADELGHSIWDVLELERFGRLSARATRALREFRDLIVGLRELAQSVDLATLLELLLERTGYAAQYDRPDEDAQSKLENLRELLSAAHSFSEQSGMAGRAALEASGLTPVEHDEPSLAQDAPALDPLGGFLDYVALVSDTDALEREGGVSLMTLHSAKGLEFTTVFLAGLEDGLIPHFNAQAKDDIEEERRLLYVGMTRARRRLLLSSCARRLIAGRYQDQDPSPFLAELPRHLLDARESAELLDRTRVEPVLSFFERSSPALGRPERERAIPFDDPTKVPARSLRRRGQARAVEPERQVRVRLERGISVRHPMLGTGVILEVEGEGGDAKLTVFFERAGKRRLIAKFAGLEPLEG
jgi:DNA helicase-2/ATP-dependent DNA helicase PcrA